MHTCNYWWWEKMAKQQEASNFQWTSNITWKIPYMGNYWWWNNGQATEGHAVRSRLGDRHKNTKEWFSIIYWVTKVISHLLWFYIIVLCDWLKNLKPLSRPNLSEVKPKPILISLHAFSHAWWQLHVFALSLSGNCSKISISYKKCRT